MYGLVNRAIEDLVRSRFGDEAWGAICRRAGIERPSFVGMQPYDDAITYGLVGAAAAELQIDAAAVLETFGEHWMTYTVEEGYGETLDALLAAALCPVHRFPMIGAPARSASHPAVP